MHLNELRDYLDDRLPYPADATTVRDRIGDTTIDSEEKSDGRTIADILDNHRDGEYASANELHQTILGELPDEYIGRKYYDDRGSNPEGATTGGKRDQAESL